MSRDRILRYFDDFGKAMRYMEKKEAKGCDVLVRKRVGQDRWRVEVKRGGFNNFCRGRVINGVVQLSPRARTKDKLHELGHKHYRHTIGEFRLIDDAEFVKREIEAEAFAYEKMEKPISYKVGLAALSVIDEFGISSEEGLELVIKELERIGVAVGEKEKAELRLYA